MNVNAFVSSVHHVTKYAGSLYGLTTEAAIMHCMKKLLTTSVDPYRHVCMSTTLTFHGCLDTILPPTDNTQIKHGGLVNRSINESTQLLLLESPGPCTHTRARARAYAYTHVHKCSLNSSYIRGGSFSQLLFNNILLA